MKCWYRIAAVPAAVVVLATSAYAATTTLSFSAPVTSTITLAGDTLYNVTTADFTGDGIPDLTFANNASPAQLRLHAGSRDGTFGAASTTTLATATQVAGSAAGDVNGDGHADVVVGEYAPAAKVLLATGNGAGTFTVTTPLTLAENPQKLLLADMTGDGNLDVIIGTSSSKLGIAVGAGDGTFSAPTFSNLPDAPSQLAVGDVDGDGTPDVASADSAAKSITVAYGNGTGGFSSLVTKDLTTINADILVAMGIGLVDLDGDGLLEVATTASANNSNDGLYVVNPRTGTGTQYLWEATPAYVTIGDVTGDGLSDVVTAWSGDDRVVIWANNGNGTLATPPFNEVADVSPGIFQAGVTTPLLAEMNGSGLVDVIAVGETYRAATLFNLLSTGGSSPAAAHRFDFSYQLPGGATCPGLGVQEVVNNTWVTLPNTGCSSAPTRLLGWSIAGQEWHFAPGAQVFAVESQRFTAKLSAVAYEYDPNVGAETACIAGDPAANVPVTQRMSTATVERDTITGQRTGALAPTTAPCTPPGNTLAGWFNRANGSTTAPGAPLEPVNTQTDVVRLYAIWK